MAKVTIINGTPTPGSRLTAIIALAEELLVKEGFEVKHVNVGELPPDDLIHTKFESEHIVKANGLVAEADAIIVASPVYKASYTGVLKTFLDLIPERGLTGKVILPMFMGGTIAHLLAIDYALKPVLSVLGARHILAGVYAADANVSRTEQGGFTISDELVDRLRDNIKELATETRRRIKYSAS
ncbi:NADPH-dependent FMN reductase [Paenibacillus lutimineralis]|uniref:FMN reductase (NADPH) n=1 Tax=Paenibacillus lutimineralis TaxID=2707005 RepID=A0A3Q9I688_9BACL|nr:NADPH-dependent FMN reductase [Paenibacillus lutimineralis]AZS13559.1 FMN reductase (NADPH) [Paenibacillus lutimineralis]